MLVKNSKLVLAHGSLALSWAILFNKPVVLITNENFDYISLSNNENIKLFQKQQNRSENFFRNSLEGFVGCCFPPLMFFSI